jgi:hypothetical protein
MIYGDGLRLTGPRKMADHFEQTCPRNMQLLPPTQPRRTQIEADWALYNGELALHTAVVAYFHLLPHPEIMIEAFSRGIPGSLEPVCARRNQSAARGRLCWRRCLSPLAAPCRGAGLIVPSCSHNARPITKPVSGSLIRGANSEAHLQDLSPPI